jgi:hydroxymethylpyrimidine pyrophosphatase-like HAD family hydrolase
MIASSMNTSAPRHMLVSDLAGAIIGHEEAFDGFRTWAAQERGHMPVVCFMRRWERHPRELVAGLGLATPDFIIGALGAEIFDFALDEQIAGWADMQRPNWNPDRAKRVIHSLRNVAVQTDSMESSPVLLAHVGGDIEEGSRAIASALAREGIDARLRLAGRELTIVPAWVSQRSAVEFLARRLRIPPAHVIVVGGEESDPEVFSGAFAGVLVKNSTINLRPALSALDPMVYRSEFRYADGVIDGVQYWREQWSLQAKRGR